ncbi:transposon Tf2-9 polyprotein [Trichonephila clavata]|uniref:Transposon Tf2-9 polyprotein n=1 Tax=Trichonephila clavata TaxID=2740835 RepID=A0A8X6I5S4_TRICU|nr:transposon Tf2-9 polyprotein [Trichonephila clavata]
MFFDRHWENLFWTFLIFASSRKFCVPSPFVIVSSDIPGLFDSSCFKEKRKANVVKVETAITKESQNIEIIGAATPKLSASYILTTDIYKQLRKLPLDIDSPKAAGFPQNESSFPECFLLNIENVLDEYDEIASKVVDCQQSDEYIHLIKQLPQRKQINDFVVKNNSLYKIENDNDILVIPQLMQTEIIKNIHSKNHLEIS